MAANGDVTLAPVGGPLPSDVVVVVRGVSTGTPQIVDVPAASLLGIPPIRTVTAGNVVILASDAGGFVCVNKTAGSATTAQLAAGAVVTIADAKGDAATNPITVLPPSGGTILGAASFVINTARGSATFFPVPAGAGTGGSNGFGGADWGVN